MARANDRLPKIPEMTIRRLSVYTRCLLQLEEDGVQTISSQELAERFSLNSAQVRKDLAYFGEFGVRGIGYYVTSLKGELQRILGLARAAACAEGRAPEERRSLDRAGDPELLPRPGLALAGRGKTPATAEPGALVRSKGKHSLCERAGLGRRQRFSAAC